MAESLTLTGQMHLSTVQAQFTNLFPRLGIAFFSSDEYRKVKRNEIATPMSTDLTVASVRIHRSDGISLHGNWQVRNFEKAFVDGQGSSCKSACAQVSVEAQTTQIQISQGCSTETGESDDPV